MGAGAAVTGPERQVQEKLFCLQDLKYRDFSCRLIPTVDPQRVIGVRTPALRRYARELANQPEGEAYLQILPHFFFEENNLHGYLLEQIRDYNRVILELERFLPYVDNWATCDTLSPAVFKRHLPELRQQCHIWLDSSHTYTVRFGIGMLMRYFLGDSTFYPEDLERVAEIRSEEYYIKMMVAWYFATALAKQYDAALPYLAGRRLEVWTHNKAIQKALESNRITPEQKAVLRSWKVK